MTTTTETYDRDLAHARTLLDEQLGPMDWPEQERQSRDDALNNAWVEGLTVAEWVRAAAASLQ